MKKLLIIVLVFFASAASAQTYDTFRVEKVLIKHQLIHPKNGKVMRHWWTKTKVKSGYILRRSDGMFVINGKLMEPDNFSYKTALVKNTE